ncbi:unnamed protein product [Strongylus vulgaris]|uniref:Uncharacterized protein n=1 Tax=Strongylus vulgaris TaxID=40348 RepID=A0A3P7LNW7_STRVU|nr:unnamed protein product [Strongylus vulgaris]
MFNSRNRSDIAPAVATFISRNLNSRTLTRRREVFRNTGADKERGIRFDVGIVVDPVSSAPAESVSGLTMHEMGGAAGSPLRLRCAQIQLWTLLGPVPRPFYEQFCKSSL